MLLSLRRFSLRLSVVIMFAATIAIGLFSLINGKSLGLTAIVTALTSALFYVTWAVQAIDNDKKALITSYLIIAGLFVSVCGSFGTFKDSPDFSRMMFDDFVSGGDSINSWTYDSVVAAAPYTLIMSLLCICGLVISFKEVNKKYKLVWGITILTYMISAFGAFLMLNDCFSEFQTCNNVNSVLTGILMLWILIIGGNTSTMPTTNTQTTSESPTPVSNQSGNDIMSKSGELIKLKELLDAGVLTQEEFDKEKRKILNQ